MTEAEVLHSLGAPQRTQQDESDIGVLYQLRQLIYPELVVEVLGTTSEGFVSWIKTESPDFPTVDGIRVGDARHKVLEIYGAPSEETTNGDITTLTYEQEPAYIFGFTCRGDRVVQIEFSWLLN